MESPVVIDGYELPVRTIVLGNLYAILHDQRVWPDADNFNPKANFLTAVSRENEWKAMAQVV